MKIATALSIVAALLMIDVTTATAEPAAAPAEGSANAGTADRTAREQRVLAFVEKNQPELAKLLAHLAKRKTEEYAEALAELDRKVLSLEAEKSKDERLYEAGLRAWQARTQVDLLVARWIAGGKKDRSKIEPQLREAVNAELDARAQHLSIRKERSAAWYDRQIVRLRDKRDEVVTSRLDDLLGDLQAAPEKNSSPKPTGRR
jgi:hypothetical protein